MTNKKKSFDRNMINCIILCLITAIFSLSWVIINDDGIFTLRDDFNVQQIPFNVLMHNTVLEKIDSWCWNLDLGSPFIQGFSFYNLGSPFFWVSLFFPVKLFPYIVGYLYILKYVVSGIFSYLYIKLFVKDPKYAVVGALLYTFSGFQSVNLLFYHFHDVVALFPLLMYSLESYMKDPRKKKLFVFSVFINCIINYFFFVQQCVFLIIYYLLRFLNNDFKKQLKDISKCIISAFWGVAMSAVLLIPNALYITGNERSDGNITIFDSLIDQKGFLYIIKGLILPGEAMHDHSSIYAMEWSSTAAYLPLLGLSLVFAYLITKKDWLSKITGFLIVISFIPILSSSFLLFAENNRRWWYTLVLMLSVVSAKVIEDIKEYAVLRGVFINASIVIVFYIFIKYIPWSNYDFVSLTYHPVRLLCYCLLALLGLAIVIILAKSKKQHYIFLVSSIMIFSIITTSSTIYFYKKNSTNPKAYLEQFELGYKLPTLNEQYRYNTTENVLTMTGNAAGLSCFSSTVANSLTDFDKLFDFYSYNIRMDKNTIPGLPELLGAKYIVVTEPTINDSVVETMQIGNTSYYIIEKPACPIGYKVNSYIYENELKSIDKDKRGIALLSSIVIDQTDESKIKNIIDKIDIESIDYVKSIDDYVNVNTANSVTDFVRNSNGFSCKSNYKNNSVIYFTVPYDNGWTALIDGKETDIITSGGMMLLPVSSGNHNIEFIYHTPGFKSGVIISSVSIGLFILSILMESLYKKFPKKRMKVEKLERENNKDF